MISFVLREHEFELGMIGSCVHTNDLLLTILHDHFRYAYNFWMGLNVTLELKCAHTPNFILYNIFNIALFRPHAIMNRQRSNQYFLHKSCILLLCDIHNWLTFNNIITIVNQNLCYIKTEMIIVTLHNTIKILNQHNILLHSRSYNVTLSFIKVWCINFVNNSNRFV